MTAQLVDAATAHHVWAERYDRDLADVFALQDELTLRIATTLVPELERAETIRAARKLPDNLDAWDCYLRGMAYLHEISLETILPARTMFRRAIELEPDYAKAHARLALTFHREYRFSGSSPDSTIPAQMLDAARKAVQSDAADSISHAMLALALQLSQNNDGALTAAQRALELNPIDVEANFTLGVMLWVSDRPREAVPLIEQAIRISPRDRFMPLFCGALCGSFLDFGEYAKASDIAHKALQEHSERLTAPMRTTLTLFLLSCLGHLGRLDEARHVIETSSRAILDISKIDAVFRSRLLAKGDPNFIEGLRKAGMLKQ